MVSEIAIDKMSKSISNRHTIDKVRGNDHELFHYFYKKLMAKLLVKFKPIAAMAILFCDSDKNLSQLNFDNISDLMATKNSDVSG